MKIENATKTLFQIYPYTIYPGWTWGEEWNGWATPYFTEQVARMVMSEFYSKWTIVDDGYVGYEDGEMVSWAPATADGIILYSIGGWSWVWEKVICDTCRLKNNITKVLLDDGGVFIKDGGAMPKEEEGYYERQYNAYCTSHAPGNAIKLSLYIKNLFGDDPYGRTVED